MRLTTWRWTTIANQTLISGKEDAVDLVMAGIDRFTPAGSQRSLDAELKSHFPFDRGQDQGSYRAATEAGSLMDAAI